MQPILRIGLMPPLTGIVSLYGQEIMNAAQLACDEINATGGCGGFRLALHIEDDGSLPGSAIHAAEKLVTQHGCAALVGNLLSSSRIAVAELVESRWKIPYLNFSFYEGSIQGQYFFHFAALPNQQIDFMIPYLVRKYGPKVFFAGSNYEWPRGSIDAAKRALASCDGYPVGEEYLALGLRATDIHPLLDQLERSGADILVPYFAGEDQIALLNAFAVRGLKPRMAVGMGHFDEAMVQQLAPHVRQGLYSSNTYFMTVDTPQNQDFLKRLAQMPGITGLWPDGNGILTNFGEATYLCIQALAQAVTRARSTHPLALVSELEKVTLQGLQGPVEMDALTHHASVNSYLTCCTARGSFEIVERFGMNPPQIPGRYQALSREHLRARGMALRGSESSREVTAMGVEAAFPSAQAVDASSAGQADLRLFLSAVDAAVLVTAADGEIIEANAVAYQIFGYEKGELLERSIHQLVPPHQRAIHREHVARFVAGSNVALRMAERKDVTGYRKDGSFFPLEASIAKHSSLGRTILVVTMRDASERRRLEESLIRNATHDSLTGLPSRTLVRERIAHALARSKRSDLNVALLALDLDGFKVVNELHGSEQGDALLKTVASLLLGVVRPGDTVSRLAVDKFVVLCEQVDQPVMVTGLAERLCEQFRQPVHVGDLQLFMTVSVGIAIGSGRTHAVEDLLRAADSALHALKSRGGDGWQFFNPGLHEEASRRMAVLNGLRHAIQQQEFQLVYQPIVRLADRRIVGAEALLRWNSPQGSISPAVFIPVAEISGLIVPIGAWCFREACRASATWNRALGEAAPLISVNLSTRQLSDENLPARFAESLRETGADPTRLQLEITETSLMADVGTNMRVIQQLTALGLSIAIDDFGTGYSSLSYLIRLPVSTLKIDKIFIDGLGMQADAQKVVRTIIHLGRSLNLKLVAEGVEGEGQLAILGELGCDLVQGYFFSRPLEAEALGDFILHHLST